MNSKYIAMLILTIALGLNISAHASDIFEAENPARGYSGGDDGSLNNNYGDAIMNALSIGFSNRCYSAEYTLRLSKVISLTAEVTYNPFYDYYSWPNTCVGVNVSLDVYFEPKALNGFYFGPDFGLKTGSLTVIDYTKFDFIHSIIISIGAKIGYRWILWDWFVINLSLLPTYEEAQILLATNIGVGLAF